MSDQSKKKQPSVIELSSDSTPSTTSDYNPKDNIEIKEEDQDSHIGSVESEYERASSSRKRKPKTMFSSRQTKRVAADKLGKEPPPFKSSQGKQPALAAGKKQSTRRIPTSPPLVNTSLDEGDVLCEVPVHKMSTVQSKQPSPEQHTRPSAVEAGKQPSTARQTQPPAEAPVQRSTARHTQLPADPHAQCSAARHTQLPAEAQGQCSTS